MAHFQHLGGKPNAKKAEAAREQEQALLTAKNAVRDLMRRPREEREALLTRLEADVRAQEQRLEGLDVRAKRRLAALREVLSVLREASEASLG